MGEPNHTVIVTRMERREKTDWSKWGELSRKNTYRLSKRLLVNTSVFAVVSLCLAGTILMRQHEEPHKAVMSHLTAGFEYDETLGRLQFVSNLLPESAMVFMNETDVPVFSSVTDDAQTVHTWSIDEPWTEYACVGSVMACCDGEISSVIKNGPNKYTVRIRHEQGYESLYSGLSAVHCRESDAVQSGDQIGVSTGNTAFEIRKDGVAIQPVFAEMK